MASSGFPTKTLYVSLLSLVNAKCPTCLILLDFITWRVFSVEQKSRNSSICNFLWSPVPSSHLAPNIFLNTLFSNWLPTVYAESSVANYSSISNNSYRTGQFQWITVYVNQNITSQNYTNSFTPATYKLMHDSSSTYLSPTGQYQPHLTWHTFFHQIKCMLWQKGFQLLLRKDLFLSDSFVWLHTLLYNLIPTFINRILQTECGDPIFMYFVSVYYA